MITDPRIVTGLRNGDRLHIHHPELDGPASATFVGYAGGPTSLVELDGTGALVQVPRVWIRKAI